MSPAPPAHVDAGRDLLWSGYRDFRDSFEAITRRARQRFEQGDWQGMRADTLQRLDLYEKVVARTQGQFKKRLGVAATHRPTWSAIKAAYGAKARNDPEGELACTFYNSVNRRVLQTIGIETQLEFIGPQPGRPGLVPSGTQSFPGKAEGITAELLSGIIAAYGFNRPFAHLAQDCALAAQHLAMPEFAPNRVCSLEMLPAPFFRDTHAYLIGRLSCRDRLAPLVLCLGSNEKGLYVDAVLNTQEQLRVLFSFSRAYFQVQTACVGSLVHFLQQLMPHKRTAELYISLGFHKHGKTELYKDLLRHRQVCSLDRAPC